MSENFPDLDAELDALIGSQGEHRLPGRDSSGNFKKGVSGNPNGRPKGTGKKQKEKAKQEEKYRRIAEKEAEKKFKEEAKKSPIIDFSPEEGNTVSESVELNAAKFMNACWNSVASGNQRLAEIAFSQMLKDKGQGQNPFAGLGDLSDVSPEELLELSDKIEEGDIDV